MEAIVSSFGLWIACSFMVIVIVVQSVLYFRLGRSEAKKLGIPKEKMNQGIRAAAITSIGPTFSSVIVLLSLVVLVGTPMAWMRLNDIGAARTEMAIYSMSEAILPEGSPKELGFTFASWGMALNNVGWMLISLLATKRMGWAVEKMNSKFSPKIVKAVMGGAAIGLFAYLVSNTLIGKASPHWIAALSAGLSLFLINKLFGKNQRLQEVSLGIALIIGMVGGSLASYFAG